VLIPTRNRNALLSLSLRTALWQRDVDFEVIVVDDGSTDATPNVLQDLANDRLRVVRHEVPRGVSSARNRGIAEARGRWVAFFDDDDVWAPGKLALQLQAAEKSGRPWVYAGAVKIDKDLRIVGGSPPPPPNVVAASLPRWNLVPGGCSGVVVLRSELGFTGGFDPTLVNLADWDLWIRLGNRGVPEWVRDPLVGYRQHSGQASLDVGLILREANVLERRYGGLLDRGALHHYLAFKCLMAGNRRGALGHFARAALDGELGPVAANVWRLLRARLDKVIGVRGRRPHGDTQWRAAASPWLAELAPSGHQRA